MKAVIAGGSGFLGTALAWAWAEEGHDVRILTRGIPAGQAQARAVPRKPLPPAMTAFMRVLDEYGEREVWLGPPRPAEDGCSIM